VKIPAWTKPGAWGVVIGAAAWWIILAAGFGWMSAGSATHLAKNKAQAAVVAYATPICVARFERQSNAVVQWKALQKSANNFNQDSFLENKKLGLIDQTGEDTAEAIANACSTKLLALKTLDGVKLASSGSASKG
jgi:hypothetical protein